MQLKYLLIAAIALVGAVNAACTTPKLRREWSQLSQDEKAAYISAVKVITSRPESGQFKDPTIMSADDFTRTHSENAHWAHANAEFLLFHRAMLSLYEKALASAGWTGGLIYLDEGLYANNWSNLDLFSSTYFGSVTASAQCLRNGAFSASSGFVDLGKNGRRECISRCGNGVFWTSSTVSRVLASARTYEDLRGDDTSNYHGTGHIVIGGNCDMSDPLWSPRDPVFYLHHAYVDKIYWKWQQICPSYKNDYEGNLASGNNPNNPLLGQSRPVNPSQPLDSWVGLTAGQMFDTTNDFLCYTYSQTAGDISYNPAPCRDGSKPVTNPWSNLKTPSSTTTSKTTTTTTTTTKQATSSTTSKLSSTSTTTTTTTIPIKSKTTTTTTTTAANPGTTPCYTAWTSQATYTKGAKVSYKNINYEGKWYADATNIPGANVAEDKTPWKAVDACRAALAKKDSTAATSRTIGAYTALPGVNETIQVNVQCNGKNIDYVVPSGCTVHKVFCSHLSIKPVGFKDDGRSGSLVRFISQEKSAGNTCPMVLRPKCDKVTEYVRPAHLKAPTAVSKNQYPSTLTDAQIADRNLDWCGIRASDVKVMKFIDELNADGQ